MNRENLSVRLDSRQTLRNWNCVLRLAPFLVFNSQGYIELQCRSFENLRMRVSFEVKMSKSRNRASRVKVPETFASKDARYSYV